MDTYGSMYVYVCVYATERIKLTLCKRVVYASVWGGCVGVWVCGADIE